MSVKQVNDVQYEDGVGIPKAEWIIGSSSDVSNIPTCAAGSVAYTADLGYMAMFDGNEWKQIGGSADE